MKSKWRLASSIIQLVVGLAAIASFIIIASSGENVARWIPTLLLAVAYAVIGAVGIITYVRKK